MPPDKNDAGKVELGGTKTHHHVEDLHNVAIEASEVPDPFNTSQSHLEFSRALYLSP